ncbi:MAG TPA: MmcQ/YjbR family DNA-binding protein [Candidatus Didemnitutus sp.]|nr:MmcQ/YjbR family DNA-binding protein [Candidatus Didemnitutus sp.]
MPTKKINFDAVREMALALPGVESSTIHGAPSLKVRGKLLCCPAIHRSAEANSLAVRIDPVARANLIEANPEVFYVTEHYRDHPTVLVRLSQIDRRSLRGLVRMAWKFVTGARTSRVPSADRRGSRPSHARK